MKDYLLGIDSGGTMTKVALFTLEGDEVASEARATEMLFPGPGFTERDPGAMWKAACAAIKAVLEKAQVRADAVAAVCATGYGNGLYCVDAKGNATRNGIVSTDSRATDIVSEWTSQGLAEQASGTLLQSIWPAQSLTLLKWLQQNEPKTVAQTHSIIQCKDYIKLCLTGSVSTDYSDAAAGGLLDLAKNEYALSVLESLGLGQWIDKLPPLLESTDIAGEVTATAAEQTGLKAGTPVVAGAVDIVVSTLASGVTRPDQVAVVAGTWSINSMLRMQPQSSPRPVLQMPYPINGGYLACEASATSASNLEWMCKKVLDADAERAEQQGRSIYDLCSDMVASRRANPADVFFFPYLYGGPDNARASFVGMSARDEKADLLHAVYEGIVFAHKAHVDCLQEAATTQAVVRLAGGASRSAVWAQMFADALNVPVETTEGVEQGALGSCVLAAVAVDHYHSVDEAVGKMTRVSSRFEPVVAMHEMYAERYRVFSKISQALSDQWG